MKITKQRLKEIIKEEVLEELETGPFDRAREKVHNMVARLRFEAKQGRAVVVSSRAGEDIDVLEELNAVLQWLNEHQQEMKDQAADTPASRGWGAT
jgi:restriction endonuclease Mrr